MQPLTAKLLRDLGQNLAQYAAIALVLACGIALTVMAFSTLESLRDAQERYYATSRFADLFATVRRAPAAMVDQVADIPGVQAAEGRIVHGALVDLPGLDQPAVSRLVSLPDRPEAALNRVVLRSGRWPESGRPQEVIALESFVQANGLALGDKVRAIAGGRLLTLTIVGTALSPEYILTVPPGGFVPDARRFAVLWMGRKPLAAAVDLEGAVNDIVASLTADASPAAVRAEVERLLAPYGALDVVGREDQPSHAFLEGEFTQLRVIGLVLPPVFLGVAAFLLSTVLRRRIELERGQIGLLKAFGYTDREVAAHYAMHAIILGLAGIVVGAGAGYWFATGMNSLYAEFYRFPVLENRFSLPGLLLGAGAGLAASLAGVWAALRHAIRLRPAVAMAPSAPELFTRGGIDLGRVVDAPTQMILRNIGRRPVRAGLTVLGLGLGLAMALLVGTAFIYDSLRILVEHAFYQSNRWEVSVSFAEPQPERSFRWIAGQPGVLRAEPQLTIGARLTNGTREERVGLSGIAPGAELQQIITPAGARLEVPPRGLILSEALAKKLDVAPGDSVRVEVLDRRRPHATLPVAGVAAAYLGTTAQMDLHALRTLLGEDGLVSGASLLVAQDAIPALYGTLRNLPDVAGLNARTETVQRFDEELTRNLTITITIYVAFASIVAFGVAYNAAGLSFSERARDLAAMRVLGFTRGETVYVLVGELILLTVAALPLGALLGFALASFFTEALATDMYRIPVTVTPRTYAFSALVMVAVAVASVLLVSRRVRTLDLLSVLKTRE